MKQSKGDHLVSRISLSHLVPKYSGASPGAASVPDSSPLVGWQFFPLTQPQVPAGLSSTARTPQTVLVKWHCVSFYVSNRTNRIAFRRKGWETGCWGLNNEEVAYPMLSLLSGTSVLLHGVSPEKCSYSSEKDKTLKGREAGVTLSVIAGCRAYVWGLVVLPW